jgi:hypothetical protein
MKQKAKDSRTAKKIIIIFFFAVVGWGLCGAIMGTGMQVMSMGTTLIAHAIGAPVIFSLLSVLYFRRFGFTTPLQTAIIFLAIVVFLDFFVIALIVLRSFEMFASPLGTWTPFALIFLSTYLSGLFTHSHTNVREREASS